MAIKSGRVGVNPSQVDAYGNIKEFDNGEAKVVVAVYNRSSSQSFYFKTSSENFELTDRCVVILKNATKRFSNLGNDYTKIFIDDNDFAYLRSSTGLLEVSTPYMMCVYEAYTNRLYLVQNADLCSESTGGYLNSSYYKYLNAMANTKTVSIAAGATTGSTTFGILNTKPYFDYVGYMVNGNAITKLKEGTDYTVSIASPSGTSIYTNTVNVTINFALSDALEYPVYFSVFGMLRSTGK